jgi:hypothetical protein
LRLRMLGSGLLLWLLWSVLLLRWGLRRRRLLRLTPRVRLGGLTPRVRLLRACVVVSHDSPECECWRW